MVCEIEHCQHMGACGLAVAALPPSLGLTSQHSTAEGSEAAATKSKTLLPGPSSGIAT